MTMQLNFVADRKEGLYWVIEEQSLPIYVI